MYFSFEEPENSDVQDRFRQIIDAVISDTCKRGGIKLQVLETRFSELIESSFKRTFGFKLLDYLTKHPDKFTMYKHAANQWKVDLTGHNLPVHTKRRKKGKQKTASKRNTQVEDFDVSIFYKEQEEKVKMDEIQDEEPDIFVQDEEPDNIAMFHSTESLSHAAEDWEGWEEDCNDGYTEDHHILTDDEGEKIIKHVHEEKTSYPNASTSIELPTDTVRHTFPKKQEIVNTEMSSLSFPKSKVLARDNTIENKETKKPESQGYDTSSCLLYTSPSPRDLSTSRMPSSA